MSKKLLELFDLISNHVIKIHPGVLPFHQCVFSRIDTLGDGVRDHSRHSSETRERLRVARDLGEAEYCELGLRILIEEAISAKYPNTIAVDDSRCWRIQDLKRGVPAWLERNSPVGIPTDPPFNKHFVSDFVHLRLIIGGKEHS